MSRDGRRGQTPPLGGDRGDRAIKLEGFRVLFRDCLQTQPREEALVVFDESVMDMIPDILAVAVELELRLHFAFVPKAYQRVLMRWKEPGRGDGGVPLAASLRAALGNVDIILNILDGDLATASVRGAMLNVLRSRGCRLAHIPGLEKNILTVLTESPIERIVARSELIAWALGETRTASLITRLGGKEYNLDLDLQSWDCDPLMSTGMIYANSWGNVPPGETFCCPDNTAAINGQVVIDGSVPGAVIQADDVGVVTFDKGRLVDVEAPRGSRLAAFIAFERQRARDRGDCEWNHFAELGIGLNPAIRKLTGNSLFDEKAAGTIHVAIGDNNIFDGHIVSEIHADMVTVGPDLILDRKKIIDRGQIDEELICRWRQEVEIPPLSLASRQTVWLDPGRLIIREGALALRLSRNGRIGYVDIGSAGVGEQLAELVSCLPTNERLTTRHLGRRLQGFGHLPLENLLGILAHYRILRFATSRQ